MTVNMTSKELAQAVKTLGFRAFYRESADIFSCYCFASDGVNVGYVELNRFDGYKYATVHKPCKSAGTGYDMGNSPTLTTEAIRNTLVKFPVWARMESDVQKYPSLEAFLNASDFNKLLIEVS